MKKIKLLIINLLLALTAYSQQTIRYDLYIQDTLVNFAKRNQKAIAINGQIPAPTLYFTEGDTAEIYVHNQMHHETSIHWHGLLLPNEQDGVPYLTTAPIKAHSTHLFKFPIRQSGTYWYHSHTMLQEQIGMYGALIIHKKSEVIDNEEIMLLSDWSKENAAQIERSLHYASDWYSLRKGATQDYRQAIKERYLPTKIANEWKRMSAMDVSDVYYERFLLNGKPYLSTQNYKPGEQVKVRIINGSASTYFWLNYTGGRIAVVANDGMPVEPVEVDRLIIGVSETYDIIITLPVNDTTSQLIATSEDRIGQTQLIFGKPSDLITNIIPRLKYFEGMKMMNEMMTWGGNMKDMGMNMSLQQMDMNAVMYPEIINQTTNDLSIVTLNYAMLKSPIKTNLPEHSFRTLNFTLTGNMNRYVWTIDNQTISESDKIKIKKGENIRIILRNNSMMRHPMHLHGHFFRLVNGKGDYSPLKTVVDIMPMETDTLEFQATEAGGDWYFHCHILYHMMSGMGRIFTYEDSPTNPQITNPQAALRKVYRDDRRFYAGAEIGLESNGSDGELRLANTRWLLQGEWRVGLNARQGFETESHFGRYLDPKQFLLAYVGWDWRYRNTETNERNIFGQINTHDVRSVFCVGIQYTLPWLINTDIRIDHTGNVRLQISRDDIPLTKKTRAWGIYNSDHEYSVGLRYILTKYWSLSTHYDSDMKLGAGLKFVY